MLLERGVDLTTMRDNFRQASLSTTSIYLHTDEEQRARQLGQAFTGRARGPWRQLPHGKKLASGFNAQSCKSQCSKGSRGTLTTTMRHRGVPALLADRVGTRAFPATFVSVSQP